MSKKTGVIESAPQTVRIALDQLICDPELQPRQEREPDEEWVERLVDAGPEAWPPIPVVAQDGSYLIVDGHHRHAAALQLGLTDIDCTVVSMPEDGDLRGLAYQLNLQHGKPLSRADMKTEATRLLRVRRELADRAIARRVGLSDKTVGSIRAELEASAEIPHSETRLGQDGRTTRPAPVKSTSHAGDQPHITMVAKFNQSQESIKALLSLITTKSDYLDTYAHDGLNDALVMAIETRPQSEWEQHAETLDVWGLASSSAAKVLREKLQPIAEELTVITTETGDKEIPTPFPPLTNHETHEPDIHELA